MDVKRFKSLAPDMQALVATAILLDGQDALTYLAADAVNSDVLVSLAAEIMQLGIELRVSLMGTLLREAVSLLSEREKV